jgi:hypothetical protein
MALSSKLSDALLGGRSQAFLSDGIFDVVLDSVMEISENDAFVVTKHTIEDGADISDHIKSDPKTVEISAILTDNDFDLLDPFSFFDETIEDREETLEIWKDDKPILTYFGHEKDIEDVVISNISRSKNQDTGEGLAIDISLVKVNVAFFLVSAISLSAVTAKGATSKGTSKKAGTATASKNKSILKSLTGG